MLVVHPRRARLVKGRVLTPLCLQRIRQIMFDSIGDLRRGVEGLQLTSSLSVLANLALLPPQLVGRPAPTLPLEIVHMILNYCKPLNFMGSRDKHFWTQVALVHRSWTPFAHRLLFRAELIKSDQRSADLRRLLDRNPALACYVENLSLKAANSTKIPSLRYTLPRLKQITHLSVFRTPFSLLWIQNLGCEFLFFTDACVCTLIRFHLYSKVSKASPSWRASYLPIFVHRSPLLKPSTFKGAPPTLLSPSCWHLSRRCRSSRLRSPMAFQGRKITPLSLPRRAEKHSSTSISDLSATTHLIHACVVGSTRSPPSLSCAAFVSTVTTNQPRS